MATGQEKDKAATGCLAALGLLFVVTPVVIILTTLWEGYILSVLWGWFFVPIGAQSITVMQAFGVSLAVKTFVKGFDTKEVVKKWKEKEKDRFTDAMDAMVDFGLGLLAALLLGLFVLGFAYVIHLCC